MPLPGPCQALWILVHFNKEDSHEPCFCPNAALPLNSLGLSELMTSLIEVCADLQNPVGLSFSWCDIVLRTLSLSLSLDL